MNKWEKRLGSMVLMATTALSPMMMPEQAKAGQTNTPAKTETSHNNINDITKGQTFYTYVKSLNGDINAGTEFLFLRLPKQSRMHFYNQTYFQGELEGYFTVGMLGMMVADTINTAIDKGYDKNELTNATAMLDLYIGNRELISELGNEIPMIEMKKHLKGKNYNEYLKDFAEIIADDVKAGFNGDISISELAMHHTAGFAVLSTLSLPLEIEESMKSIHSVTTAEELAELCIEKPVSLEAEISMFELPKEERIKFYKYANQLETKQGVFTQKMFVLSLADTLTDVINHQDNKEKLGYVYSMLEHYQGMLSIDKKELSAAKVDDIEKSLNGRSFGDVAKSVSNFIDMQVREELTNENVTYLLPKFKKDFPLLMKMMQKELYPSLNILLDLRKQNLTKDLIKNSIILNSTDYERG